MKALATLSAASILTLVGAAAVAQQAASPATPPSPPASPPASAAPAGRGPVTGPEGRGPTTRADMDALTDARMAGIPAGLKLTDEQRRLWGPVEQALRAQATERAERREAHRRRLGERREPGGERPAAGTERPSRDRPDFMERIERQSATMSAEAGRLQSLAAAMKPFWASLDERQKRLLPRLVREARDDRCHRDGRGDGDRPRR